MQRHGKNMVSTAYFTFNQYLLFFTLDKYIDYLNKLQHRQFIAVKKKWCLKKQSLFKVVILIISLIAANLLQVWIRLLHNRFDTKGKFLHFRVAPTPHILPNLLTSNTFCKISTYPIHSSFHLAQNKNNNRLLSHWDQQFRTHSNEQNSTCVRLAKQHVCETFSQPS